MNNTRAEMLRANLGGLKWTLKKYFSFYPVLAPLAVFCILFTAAVSAIPSLFVQRILSVVEKWYASGDWAAARPEILRYIYILIALYVLSLLSQLFETQIMAVMTQGFLDKMRRELFNGMQDLPIRYFDGHQTGDIMSFYTNDIDTR